jgi:hypothetical protein
MSARLWYSVVMAKKEHLTEVVKVRVTPTEYRKIAEAAADAERKISDYIRLVLAGKVERP